MKFPHSTLQSGPLLTQETRARCSSPRSVVSIQNSHTSVQGWLSLSRFHKTEASKNRFESLNNNGKNCVFLQSFPQILFWRGVKHIRSRRQLTSQPKIPDHPCCLSVDSPHSLTLVLGCELAFQAAKLSRGSLACTRAASPLHAMGV